MRKHARRVLVVDDNDSCRAVYEALLEGAGYVVLGVANGVEALAALDAMGEPPHAIVLDLVMPIMNGWQFMEALELRPGGKSIPVLVTSGTHRPGAGGIGTDFLAKPVDPDALVSWVGSLAIELDPGRRN